MCTCFRVFQLISLMDAQLPRSSNEKVELAVLWFLDQFRKTYVGDQLQRTSKVGVFPKCSYNIEQRCLCIHQQVFHRANGKSSS